MNKSSHSRYSLPVGVFSNPPSLMSSINKQTESKGKTTQKGNQSKTKFSFEKQISARSSFSPNLIFEKYNIGKSQKIGSNELFSKPKYFSISELKQLQVDTPDNDVSIQLKSPKEVAIKSIHNNLKRIMNSMDEMKSSQANLWQLSQWQKELSENCRNLLTLSKSDDSSNKNHDVSIFDFTEQNCSQPDGLLLKLLAEEKNNRLKVEEQTSKIIASQEQEIQNLVEKMKQLERKQYFNT